MPSLSIVGSIDVAGILGSCARARSLLPEEVATITKEQATLLVSSSGSTPGIIQLTPPFAGKNGGGLASGKHGINRDLAGIFVPVALKGRRKVTQMFGKPLKKPVFVTTREKYPNVGEIYNERKARQIIAGRKLVSLGRRQPYYVDKTKLELLRRELYTHIGWAAACWLVAALEAGLDPKGVPPFVQALTAAPGSAVIEVTNTSFSLLLSSSLPYNQALDMARKVATVCGYRQNAFTREVNSKVGAILKRAGLNAA